MLDRSKTALALVTVLALFTTSRACEAQQTRVYRVGVIHQGGSYDQAIVGLQDGLKELGWKQGEQTQARHQF